jgi:quinol monooxygenase YgiN
VTIDVQPIHICAIIRAKSGVEGQLKAELAKVVDKTVSEPGCLQFQIHEFSDNPGQFMLWECFVSAESLREHMTKDYTKAYFATAQQLMSEPTEVIRLTRFGGKG